MRLFLTTLLFSSFLLTSGCFGITQPSESQVESLSKAYFDKQMGDLFTVTQVTKLNGYKENDSHYIADVKITATALKSLDTYATEQIDNTALSMFGKMTSGLKIAMLKMTLPAFEAGDTIDFDTSFLFIKTDNGWMLKKELPKESRL